MASQQQNWEDLRRQARRLENELDLKLVSFSKLGASYQHNRYHGGNAAASANQHASTDHTPLLAANHQTTNEHHMVDTMAMEIEQLITKLTGTNDMMCELSEGGKLHGSALIHTIQRHREILQDYNREFRKVRANIHQHMEREDLIGSVRRDIDAYKNASGVNNRRTEMYLKEHEHLRNSDRLADEAIEMAMATKENIGQQRTMFRGITARMNNLANRFPGINSLVQKINLRKRRDSVILACVISACVILILLYALH